MSLLVKTVNKHVKIMRLLYLCFVIFIKSLLKSKVFQGTIPH